MPTAQRVEIGNPPTSPHGETADPRFFPGFEVTAEVRIDSAPAAAGAAFIGSAFPRDGRSSLSFYGFNAEGTLWRIDTNPSCVGTVLTSVGGQPAVVILDSDASKDGQGPAVRPGAGSLWSKSFAHSARITAAGPGVAYAALDGVAAKIDIDSGSILDTGNYVLPVSMLPDGTALFPTKERTVYAMAVPEKQGAPG